MKVEMSPGNCQVIREKGDPRFSGILYAKGESRLLHHLKVILNKQGYDLIKKRMTKDGHLVDSMQQYLRTRKPSGDPNKDLYIYNSMWAIQGADEDFRRRGSVSLRVESNVFNPQQGARHGQVIHEYIYDKNPVSVHRQRVRGRRTLPLLSGL